MPMVSEAQRRLMWKAKNDPAFAKARGISKKVANEFTSADQGGKLPERKSREDKRYK